MQKTLLLAAILLAGATNPLLAEEPKPAPVKVTIRLCEGKDDAVITNTTGRIEIGTKETKKIAFTNESGGVSVKRVARVLGRDHIPYGVFFELTAERCDTDVVELDAIISVLGPPTLALDEGKMFPDQSMRGALNMTPGKAVKVPLPRAWFVTTLNEHKLKTKDGPVWVELVVEPRMVAVSPIGEKSASPLAQKQTNR